jgi:NADPH-dependent 2,4-dienoyl-CoA reductase/sulfur reductase-like enzyme
VPPTSYPHIFAIGDAADAFGAVPAGHNAYAQGEVAARNIITLIKHRAAGGGSTPELEQYTPGEPAIKVSLGLVRSSSVNIEYYRSEIDVLTARFCFSDGRGVPSGGLHWEEDGWGAGFAGCCDLAVLWR